MTVEQAVAVLNEWQHRGSDDWKTNGRLVYFWDSPTDMLTCFEAIAIATAYQQQEEK